MRKLLVGWLAALAACVVATTAQSPVALKDLTVPADRLATDCALAPKDSERFEDAQTASREAEKMRSTRNTTRAVHVVTGPIVAVLHGDGGACFKVLAAHLTALAR